jgi:murein DD-endopeptidase MepM/ murein hydrolase activator NlpD
MKKISKALRVFVLLCLTVILVSFQSGHSMAASQPSTVILNPNGTSYISWMFDTPENTWVRTASTGYSPTHKGDDYFADDWARSQGTYGQSIYASISGIAILQDYGNAGYGKSVVIYDDTSHFAVRYAHLSEILVSPSQKVQAGANVIGKVGSSGTQDAHLHIVLYKNVSGPTQRPITGTVYSGGATGYAAPFYYVSRVTGDQPGPNPPEPDNPSIPQLLSPADGITLQINQNTTFSWSNAGASQYKVEIWNDSGNGGSMSSIVNGTSTQFAPAFAGSWRWQVRSILSNGQPGDAPHTRSFTVPSTPQPVDPQPQPVSADFQYIEPLTFSPSNPVIGQTVTARFVVKNTSGHAITMQRVVAALRGPDCADWAAGDKAGKLADFWLETNIVVQPGQTYTYSHERDFSEPGSYLATPSYQDIDGNWRSNFGNPENFSSLKVSKLEYPVRSNPARITSVQFKGGGKDLKMTVNGTSLGNAPVSMPFSGNLPYIAFEDFDSNPDWSAGHNTGGWITGVHLRYSFWTDNQIQIDGFAAEYGQNGYIAKEGDHVQIELFNGTPTKQIASWQGVIQTTGPMITPVPTTTTPTPTPVASIPPSSAASAYFEPSVIDAKAGSEFLVTIGASSPNHAVSAGELHLSFSPSILEVISYDPGPLLGENPIRGINKLDPASGTLVVALARLGASPTTSQPDVFLKVRFRVKELNNTKDSSLKLDSLTLSDERFLGMTVSLPGPATIHISSNHPGDGNGDNLVDYRDLAILGASYGTKTGEANFDSRADFNQDGIVDYRDLAILGANYGR